LRYGDTSRSHPVRFAEPDAAIPHGWRQLFSTEYGSLPILVCSDGITAPANLLAARHSVCLEADPPDAGAGLLFVEAVTFFVIFRGILRPFPEELIRAGTRCHYGRHRPKDDTISYRALTSILLILLLLMVTLGRFELPTCGLGNRRSIHLSYRATWL
jgi:hypothetical protein